MGNMSSLYYLLRTSVFANPITTNANTPSNTNTIYERMNPHMNINSDFSRRDPDRCNYSCPTCKKSGKMPTISGRFHIINDKECQCNACYSIFNKNIFYKSYATTESIPSSNSASNYNYNLYSINGIKNYLKRARSSSNTKKDSEEVIIELN